MPQFVALIYTQLFWQCLGWDFVPAFAFSLVLDWFLAYCYRKTKPGDQLLETLLFLVRIPFEKIPKGRFTTFNQNANPKGQSK